MKPIIEFIPDGPSLDDLTSLFEVGKRLEETSVKSRVLNVVADAAKLINALSEDEAQIAIDMISGLFLSPLVILHGRSEDAVCRAHDKATRGMVRKMVKARRKT